jgi:hypothetical protein
MIEAAMLVQLWNYDPGWIRQVMRCAERRVAPIVPPANATLMYRAFMIRCATLIEA